MVNVSAVNLQKDFYTYLDSAIESNNIINVNTQKGNVIMLSEQEYNGLMETIYLNSIPEVKKQIIEGMATPLSECLSEDEVEW